MWRLKRHHLLMLTGRLVSSHVFSLPPFLVLLLICSFCCGAVFLGGLLTPDLNRNCCIKAKHDRICLDRKGAACCLFPGWLPTSKGSKSALADAERPCLALDAGAAASWMRSCVRDLAAMRGGSARPPLIYHLRFIACETCARACTRRT